MELFLFLIPFFSGMGASIAFNMWKSRRQGTATDMVVVFLVWVSSCLGLGWALLYVGVAIVVAFLDIGAEDLLPDAFWVYAFWTAASSSIGGGCFALVYVKLRNYFDYRKKEEERLERLRKIMGE